LRTQLFKKVSDQKDNTQDTSVNTKFAKQPIVENLPKIGVNNDKVIAPGMFRINPDKTSREAKKVPNTVRVVQIVLWYLDSGCSKHMTGDRLKLINYVEKFIGIVRLKNDQFAKIVGYSDYKLGDTIISRVYYVEGLNHNLFSVGQFCDGGLEVAFRQHTCHIRNMYKVDLLQGSRSTNLYSISLNDMLSASPVCLLTKASSTKSWLWHRRLNHLNFGTLNELARINTLSGFLSTITWGVRRKSE
nr:integrase, catalytic region, zinc finger, CCHC-type, peptidase aspartic, catalytic [Tanacetum cinerariifolium]